MNNLEPVSFYFELPIYTPIKIDRNSEGAFLELIQFSGSVDYYNPSIGENTTYKVDSMRNVNVQYYLNFGGWAYSVLSCVRTNEEFYFYYYYNNISGVFQKIGQYPSVATFHISKIKNYKSVLSADKLKEFTRAIGLAANGVGIGSFVYLRRIFEGLIEEAHHSAKQKDGWREEDYRASRMAERIELLREYLPDFLVQNKTLYSMLSVGIHQLQEEECLAYFETVKVGIEFILDEKLQEARRQQKLAEASQKLSALTSKINKPSDSK